MRLGNTDEAIKTISKIVSLKNISSLEISRYNFIYGLLYEKKKDYPTARAAFSRARRGTIYSAVAKEKLANLPGM